jgi:LacI family transcriptional regulator
MKEKKNTENIPNRIRIVDIARMANVSVGTVDRVIHKRGRVAPEKVKEIKRILKELDYQPNILASSLANKKTYNFVALIPSYDNGEYWEKVVEGVEFAKKELKDYNIVIHNIYFDQFDSKTFELASEKLLAFKPEGALIAPHFLKEAFQLTEKLTLANIPFVLIDSEIRNSKYLAFFGQNSFESGEVGAEILMSDHYSQKKILICHVKKQELANTNKTEEREKGFRAFFEQSNLKNKPVIIDIDLDVENNEKNIELLDKLFKSNHDITGAIAFNSKIHSFAYYLEYRNISTIKVLGYDLTSKNIAYLNKNKIAYLIAQRPDRQGYLALKAMCNYLLFHREPKQDNFIPIDIITKGNVNSHLQFSNID